MDERGSFMIYLDNAATTWPKPQQVVAAIEEALVCTREGMDM